MAADLFASLASIDEHNPPAEVQEGMLKLENPESPLESPSVQIDPRDSQKNLSETMKTRRKENKKGVETFTLFKEVRYDRLLSPYTDDLPNCDAPEEETNYTYE